MSSEHPPPCHYYGQAFGVWKFYTKPMALRIKQLRNAKGWTQDVLAAKSGMSRSQLAAIITILAGLHDLGLWPF